eukprot:1195180-Prorocentrum_minimum.AAC.2
MYNNGVCVCVCVYVQQRCAYVCARVCSCVCVCVVYNFGSTHLLVAVRVPPPPLPGAEEATLRLELAERLARVGRVPKLLPNQRLRHHAGADELRPRPIIDKNENENK